MIFSVNPALLLIPAICVFIVVLFFGHAFATPYVGTTDSTEFFGGVGLLYSAQDSGYRCDHTYVKGFFSPCTASLLDTDDLLTLLGGFTTTDKNLLRRRVLTVPAQCVQPYVAGEQEGSSSKCRSPSALLQNSSVIFRFDAPRSPGITHYQQILDLLGFQPCAGFIPLTTPVTVTTAINYTVYRASTVGIGTFSPHSNPGLNFALLVTDGTIPSTLVSNTKLLRIQPSTYANISRDILTSVVLAGYPNVQTDFYDLLRSREFQEVRADAVSPTGIVSSGPVDYVTNMDPLCANPIGAPVFNGTGSNLTLGNLNALGMVTGSSMPLLACGGGLGFSIVRIGTPHWRLWAKRVLRTYIDLGATVSRCVQVSFTNEMFVISAATNTTTPIEVSIERAPELITSLGLAVVFICITFGLLVLLLIITGILNSCSADAKLFASLSDPKKTSKVATD